MKVYKLREGFCNYTIDNILMSTIEKSFNEVFEEIEIGVDKDEI